MELTNFDAADHLKTPEDVKDYLALSCQWNDPIQIIGALRNAARAQANMAEPARTIDGSHASLHHSLTQEADPSLAIAMRVANALGYTFTIVPIQPVPGSEEAVSTAQAPTNELETICGEAYQVIGILASEAGRFDDPAVHKALDNLSQQRLIHDDVLPFPSAHPAPGTQPAPDPNQ